MLETHSKKVTDAHWQADSQRCWALQVSALWVAGGKDGENKLKGDEEFNHQGMTSRDMSADLKGAVQELGTKKGLRKIFNEQRIWLSALLNIKYSTLSIQTRLRPAWDVSVSVCYVLLNSYVQV